MRLEEKKAEAEAAEVQKVSAELLPRHRAAIERDARDFVANPNGKITVTEFFDYNCGYCKRALSDLRVLMKADPKLRVVLKDFPVLGPDSVESARVALAVKQQLKGDKLFDYHARLIETRGKVNGERAMAVAKEVGVDMARLAKDMEGPEVRAALQENMSLADKLGLTGTPAFVIGDEVISGAVGVEPIRRTLAGVRQCGKAVC